VTASRIDHVGIRVTPAPSCYLCGERGTLAYAHLHDHLFSAPGVWSLRRCPACALVWLDPQPHRESHAALYAQYYTHAPEVPDRLAALRHGIRRLVLAAAYGYEELATGRLERTVGRLLSWIGPLREIVGGSVRWLDGARRGRLLDVGAGDGHFLAHMRDLGWDVRGVEPDSSAVRVAAERFGLPVTHGTLDTDRLALPVCDAITLFHVLEHVPDPVATLAHAKQLLRPSGQVVVVTPNAQSLAQRLFRADWRGWEPPRHLFVFSPATLRTCAERAGLQVRQLRTTARGAFFMWRACRRLRRQARSTTTPPPGWEWLYSFEGLFFWALEHALVKARPWGEEIVLIAGS